MAWQHDRWGVLPDAGGARDQEPGRLMRMAIAIDAFRLWEEYEHLEPGTGAAWQRSNPRRWARVEELIEVLNGECD